MRTINFFIPIKGLDGKPLMEAEDKPLYASKLLASSLVSGNRGDAIKVYHWALSLYDGKPLTLDKADEKTLKELIENDQTMTILAKAQLLEAFDKSPAVYPVQPE